MPERINGGMALAGLGGLVLLVSLFLTWYEPSRDAWTVFELNDLILAALGLVAIASLGVSLTGSSGLGSALGGSIPYAGIGALIIVAATLIQSPPAAHSTPQVGAWVALAGAVAMTVGGLLLRSRVSVVIALRPREREETSTVRGTSRPEGRMPSSVTDASGAYEPRPDEREYSDPEYPEEEATETQRLPGEERP